MVIKCRTQIRENNASAIDITKYRNVIQKKISQLQIIQKRSYVLQKKPWHVYENLDLNQNNWIKDIQYVLGLTRLEYVNKAGTFSEAM